MTDSGSDAANSSGYVPVTNGQFLSFSNTDGISRTINVASTSAVIDCNTTSAIDEIQFKMASGNIDAGDICLYGIK